MGNYYGKQSVYIYQNAVNTCLISVLLMTIENRMNSDPRVNRTAEVCKLEDILDIVHSGSTIPGHWETIVNETFKVVLESSLSETFCNITEEMKQTPKVYHVLAVYALFVDVMHCNASLCQKQHTHEYFGRSAKTLL